MTDAINHADHGKEALRLAELRARREQLERAREQREEQREQAEALAREQRMIAELEALERAEQDHGATRVRVVETALGAVIVKAPHVATWRRFQDRGQTKNDDLDKLVRPCVVYPASDVLDEILTSQPGVLIRLADAVAWLAGVRAEDMHAKS